MQQQYSLDFDMQFHAALFPELGIQFLSLNSAWEIDEHNPKRSSVRLGALARGLRKADEQVHQAQEKGELQFEAPLLKIAVWHHAITGNEKIEADSFIGQVQRAGFKLCFHGDVHEIRQDVVGYLNSTRKLFVVGSGTLSAPARARPESTPRLFNLIEVDREAETITVHTRSQQQEGSPFGAYAVWPGPEPTQKRSYYTLPY